MSIWLQNFASIQPRTSPVEFDHFAEKSEKDTVSNLAPKAWTRETLEPLVFAPLRAAGVPLRLLPCAWPRIWIVVVGDRDARFGRAGTESFESFENQQNLLQILLKF